MFSLISWSWNTEALDWWLTSPKQWYFTTGEWDSTIYCFLYSRLQIQTPRHTSSGQNLGLTGLLFYVYSLYFDVNIWHSIPNNNPFIPEYCQGVNPCMQSAVLYISVKPQNFSRYPEMCLQAEFPTLSSLRVHCIMNTGKSLTLQANQFNFIEFRQVEM